MSAGSAAPPPAGMALWMRTSQLLADAGFTHAFCHHGRPSDAATCAAVAPACVLQRAHQVHGAAVVRASGWSEDAPPEADAVISADPCHACAVRTADCGPVLLACCVTGAAAAVHAGWRGIASRVIPAAISALVQECGAVPSRMVAAVGPCARGRRYEVGEEVASAVSQAGCAHAIIRHASGLRPFLDVAQACAIQLAACGIPSSRIDADPPCSIESPWCPSHRRDPASGTRMLSLIVPTLVRAHG